LQIGTPGWNNLTAKAARALENLSSRKSSAMTTLTAAVVPILQQRHKSIPSIREVIPTCVQTSKFLPSPMPQGQITCLLSGTFNNYYDINRMKQVLDEIRKSMDLFVIWARAGESPMESLGVGEDLIITASHSEMPRLVQESHFGIAICKQDNLDSLAAAVPTKIGEFLACGKPIVVNKGLGDMDKLIKEFNVGIVLDGEKENLIKGALELIALLSDPELPNRCRALAENHFSMDVGAKSYLNLYSRMTRSSGNDFIA
jgi:hypothetical protein